MPSEISERFHSAAMCPAPDVLPLVVVGRYGGSPAVVYAALAGEFFGLGHHVGSDQLQKADCGSLRYVQRYDGAGATVLDAHDRHPLSLACLVSVPILLAPACAPRLLMRGWPSCPAQPGCAMYSRACATGTATISGDSQIPDVLRLCP